MVQFERTVIVVVTLIKPMVFLIVLWGQRSWSQSSYTLINVVQFERTAIVFTVLIKSHFLNCFLRTAIMVTVLIYTDNWFNLKGLRSWSQSSYTLIIGSVWKDYDRGRSPHKTHDFFIFLWGLWSWSQTLIYTDKCGSVTIAVLIKPHF